MGRSSSGRRPARLRILSGWRDPADSAKRTPPKRGGIVPAGGQDGDQGTLILKDNVIRGNGGPGILKSRLRLVVDSTGNDVSGNEAA